jgi:hypothetical protein
VLLVAWRYDLLGTERACLISTPRPLRIASLILAILRLRVGSILKSESGAKCS